MAMRTTVTLDPDVHRLLRDTTHRSGKPFKQVLNDAVRVGLRAGASAKPAAFKQRSYALGKPLVDLTKANALAADLEDAERLAKLRSGR